MPHSKIMSGHTIAHLLDLIYLYLSLLPRLLVFQNDSIFNLSYSLHSLLSVYQRVDTGYISILEFTFKI